MERVGKALQRGSISKTAGTDIKPEPRLYFQGAAAPAPRFSKSQGGHSRSLPSERRLPPKRGSPIFALFLISVFACDPEPRPGRIETRIGGWSGRRDLNPRLQPWQGCTLPLSYSRPNRKGRSLSSSWRRHPDLNRRMEVLQTSALPLGYAAPKGGAGNGI